MDFNYSHKSIFAFFVALVFITPSIVLAQNSTLYFVNNQVNISPELLYQSSTSTERLFSSIPGPGVPVLIAETTTQIRPGLAIGNMHAKQHGLIPGIGLTATKTFDALYTRINMQVYSGDFITSAAMPRPGNQRFGGQGTGTGGQGTGTVGQRVGIIGAGTTDNFIVNADLRQGYLFAPHRTHCLSLI